MHSATVSVEVRRPLDELAAELKREHEACEGAFQKGLEHALRCGELLLEAKDQAPHGQWELWLMANFAGSLRTARGYMQLARNRERLDLERRSVAVLGIGQALKALAPKPDIGEQLRGLGSAEGALESLGDPQPEDWVSLRSGVARKTWQEIQRSIARANSTMDSMKGGRRLIPWAMAALLREAAADHKEIADELLALADHILEQRG
jgi:hypothetical protein